MPLQVNLIKDGKLNVGRDFLREELLKKRNFYFRVTEFGAHRSIFSPLDGKYVRDTDLTFEEMKKWYFKEIEIPETPDKTPFKSPLPDLLDISITSNCDRGCPDCYMNASPGGDHMDIELFERIIKAVNPFVYQVALGGGEPTSHPQFTEMLKICTENGIVPNFTSNGSFMNDGETRKKFIKAIGQHCGAMAFSYYETMSKVYASILGSIGIKANLHFVLNEYNVQELIDLINSKPYINALIILMYKPVGRASINKTLYGKNPLLEELARVIYKNRQNLTIGFDTCSAPFVTSRLAGKFKDRDYDFCEAGRYSCYIDEKGVCYPCSFMKTGPEDGVPFNENFYEVWDSGIFETFRSKLRENSKRESCSKCEVLSSCFGGCPIFGDLLRTCDV